MEYANSIVYTDDKTQVVFLKDADIINDMTANTISGNSVLSNGIPSYDLFKKHYILVSNDISGLSDDVEFLKGIETSAVVYSGTLLSASTEENDQLTSFLYSNFHDYSYAFKQGQLFRLSASQMLRDAKLVQKQLGENDYLLFNKSKLLSDVQFEDIDFIRDAFDEVLSVREYSDARLDDEISKLSTSLSNDIDNLSEGISNIVVLSVENLQKQVTGNDNDIAMLSDVLENTISANLNELSSGTSQTSALLEDQIKTLQDNVRGGVNYKGHLRANSTSKFPDGANYDLSTVFASYYDLMNDSKELTSDKILENGWLYNFTTDDVGGFTTGDGVALENNDYIIIHKHDSNELNVSEISRDNIDIIEAVQDDYVRFTLLNDISNVMSVDYVQRIAALSDTISNTTELSVQNLQEQVTSNDDDITFLSGETVRISTELSANVSSVSIIVDSICADLQLQVSANDKDIADVSAQAAAKVWIKDPSVRELEDGAYSDLSVVKILEADYSKLAADGKLDSKTLYVISSDYVESYGQVISNMTMTDDPTESEAASQHYVDSIKSSIELSVDKICAEISADDADISNLQEKQLSISTRYTSTFAAKDTAVNSHISSDNMILTDITSHIGDESKHKQYYMSLEDGTIVLKPLNF